MNRYLWCAPIKPGMKQVITEEWTNTILNTIDPAWVEAREEVHDRCGVREVNAWIQHRPNEDLILFYWDTENWEQMWSEFRKLLAEKNLFAIAAQKGFLELLGVDLSKKNAIPEPEVIAQYEWGKLPANQIVRIAHAYPILEGREESQREFSLSCNQKNRDRFQKLCHKLGLTSLSRSFVKSGPTTYYMVYQECDLNSWNRLQEFLHGSSLNEGNEWLWEPLLENTGISREELIPELEWLVDSAPVTTRR